MAKKQCGKSITGWNRRIIYGYECGMWQSALCHTILLLILSLITSTDKITKPIKIALSFTSKDDNELVSLEKIKDSIEIIKEETNLVEEYERIDVKKITSTHLVDLTVNPEESSDNNSTEPEINKKDLLSFVGPGSDRNDDFVETNSSGNINNLIDNIRTSINTSLAENNAGIGDEFSKRLAGAGAKTGDVQISIIWNTTDDIDLHVVYTPGNGSTDNINWTNRIGRISNGMLDVDRNANGGMLVNTPVENIFWPKGYAPNGFFTVYVHFYRSWTGGTRVPVLVRLKIGNKFEEVKCLAILYQSPQEVSRFKFEN
jgi:hypothetical protein